MIRVRSQADLQREVFSACRAASRFIRIGAEKSARFRFIANGRFGNAETPLSSRTLDGIPDPARPQETAKRYRGPAETGSNAH
ncbi:hypothetical protein sS8_1365 [Methylocaldum marinum]|uniref:Uncharacterized protein n=1 Tax=Methylocaldum marinum TaxID=1432792 RepID=A0A250KNR9_9GAMM|nr:hypothetical protein sS8_1365 [Methylocaldum marinum]